MLHYPWTYYLFHCLCSYSDNESPYLPFLFITCYDQLCNKIGPRFLFLPPCFHKVDSLKAQQSFVLKMQFHHLVCGIPTLFLVPVLVLISS